MKLETNQIYRITRKKLKPAQHNSDRPQYQLSAKQEQARILMGKQHVC